MSIVMVSASKHLVSSRINKKSSTECGTMTSCCICVPYLGPRQCQSHRLGRLSCVLVVTWQLLSIVYCHCCQLISALSNVGVRWSGGGGREVMVQVNVEFSEVWTINKYGIMWSFCCCNMCMWSTSTTTGLHLYVLNSHPTATSNQHHHLNTSEANHNHHNHHNHHFITIDVSASW